MSKNIRTMTYGGILSAVILLATIINFPIPGGYGYMNFGDGAIFAAAVVLGPYAAISAALGSALADLVAGYPHYILPTFLIKGLMGLLAGLVFARAAQMKWPGQLLLFAVCETVMIGGYFLTEIFFYGLAAAAGSLAFNALQALAGIVVGLAIVPLARRIKV